MDIDEILSKALTPDQLSAVKDNSRNILCLACAGSGKSRTLAYKNAYLIANGENPESIVAFTFTEKAADSIKRRGAEALKSFGLSENYLAKTFADDNHYHIVGLPFFNQKNRMKEINEAFERFLSK